MSELVPSSITDVLAYLAPGLIVLVAVAYRWMPGSLTTPQQGRTLTEPVVVTILSYVFGILIFKLAEYVIYPLGWYFHKSVLEGIIADFPELSLVRDSLVATLGIGRPSDLTVYRYASQVLFEKAPRTSDSIERLLAISHMFRALLVSLPVAVVVIWRPAMSERSRVIRSAVLLAVLVLEFSMLRIFLSFWASAVWRTLRGYIVWDAIGG